MTRSQRRLLLVVAAVPVLVVLSALVYMWGMGRLEGHPRGFWDSLEWAGETLTTTGYGADTTWQHPAMVVFVVTVQFVGVFLVFLIFPIYLIPFLEERFEARLPTRVKGMTGHVVVYRFGAAVATLLGQLEEAGVPTLVVEQDEAQARRAAERGRRVILSRLEDEALEAACLPRARALIANDSDAENAAVILAARQSGFTGDVLSLVEEPVHRKPLMLAGATAVYTPRHLLGAALAARASGRISPRVAGVQQIGKKLLVREMRVGPKSPLAGATLRDAGIGARTGATAIGQWVGGELLSPLTGATRLRPNGILVAVGSQESLRRLEELADGATPLDRGGAFVVAGYGEVGKKVVELLRDVGEGVRVIDRKAGEGVDLVGDALDPRVLEAAGIREAQAVILALDSDSATLFATVIIKEHAPEVPVIARVNEAENVERIHRAGVDFALSMSQVSGQILARRLLGQEAVAVDPALKVLKVPVAGLEGRHPTDLDIREHTGCSVVAVERGEEVLVDFPPDFRFQAGDEVYVSGSSEAVDRVGKSLAR
jgi:Trk K+ transport system NAD-binding subunit